MLKFTKMHGLGNDFVVFDAIRQRVHLSSDQVRRIADRHYGVGCDQILLVEPPLSADADFRYRIFNADGGEVFQCGNGARCVARFVREKGLCARDEIRVGTGAGVLLVRHQDDGNISVNMGVPKHKPAEIPLLAEREAPVHTILVDGIAWDFSAVSLGNPHAVLIVPDIDAAPVTTVGPILERHHLFPQGVNSGFMQILDHHHIRLRVFERGAGETLACGSGACAAAVVGIEHGHLHSPVQADLPGGRLTISWQGRETPVFMSGPAVSVFEGTIIEP
jgi:diaminopimelate epimerase